jgi:hypothetical protein
MQAAAPTLKDHSVSYSVLGVGSTAYKDTFCKFAIDLEQLLQHLNCDELIPLKYADAVSTSFEDDYYAWIVEVALIHRNHYAKRESDHIEEFHVMLVP